MKPTTTNDAPVTYLDDDGRVRVARDWRRFRDRDRFVGALTASVFEDAARRSRRGSR